MKMLRLMICLVGVLWLVIPARAQDELGPHDGVTGLVDCGGELSPADRMHCENVQLDAADENLNRIYRTLMEVLDKEAKAMLLDGQRGWLKYRDRNLELFSSAASPRGQQGMAEQIRWLRELTEDRVRELENLYRLFQQNGLLAVNAPQTTPAEPQPASAPQPEPVTPAPASAPPALEPPAPAPAAPAYVVEQPPAPAPQAPELQPEAPAPAFAVTEPQPAPPVPSKGVIMLNGKVVRPSDFGTAPNVGEIPAPPAPAPAPGAEQAEAPAPPAPAVADEPAPSPAAPAISESAPAPSAPASSALILPTEPKAGPPMPESAAKTAIKSEAGLKTLLGRHPLRLQWLSSEPFGEALIEDRGGTLHLSGSQGQGKNRLVIEGIITTVRDDNFTFHGTVTTSAGFLDGGKPCVRSGRMWFVRKDGRPFWRLQSITSPCTGVSDYIDIYLKPIQE